MNKGTKIVLMIALLGAACFFGLRFRVDYARFMDSGSARDDTDLTNPNVPDRQRAGQQARADHQLGTWGGGLVISVVLLGLMVAHEASQFFGNRAAKLISDDDRERVAGPDYDKAEETWANGEFLEAIQLFRDYLKVNPRELHVSLRIAEIYEKDLHNYLASALEYEEVLRKRLPPERWGWAAIHLCNLYTSKLNQPDKAIALLKRIDADYGETAAAEKARKRLAQLGEDGYLPSAAEPLDEPAPPPSNLPPGFAPKK